MHIAMSGVECGNTEHKDRNKALIRCSHTSAVNPPSLYMRQGRLPQSDKNCGGGIRSCHYTVDVQVPPNGWKLHPCSRSCIPFPPCLQSAGRRCTLDRCFCFSNLKLRISSMTDTAPSFYCPFANVGFMQPKSFWIVFNAIHSVGWFDVIDIKYEFRSQMVPVLVP